MKMMTKQLEKQIPTFDEENPCFLLDESTTVYAHYFVGNNDIWIFNYNKEKQIFFGYVYLCPSVKETMIFSLKQLEGVISVPLNINGNLIKVPMKWERELYFQPTTLKEVIDNEKSGLNKFEGMDLFI